LTDDGSLSTVRAPAEGLASAVEPADPTGLVGRYLVAQGSLSPAALARARRRKAEAARFEATITRLGVNAERELAEALAAFVGQPLALPAEFPDAPVAKQHLSPAFLRQARLVPLAETGGTVTIAMVDPLDEASVRAVAHATGKAVLRRVAAPADVELAIERLYGAEAASP